MKKGIKKEVLEEIDLMQGIDFKANQVRMREHKERLERLKREQRKETILATFIAIVIVVMTIALLVIDRNITEDAKESCMNVGHSENYCLSKI